MILILAILVLGFIFRSKIFWLSSKSTYQKVETYTVWSWNIAKSISAQGQVSVPQSLEIWFAKAWTVSNINKKVGDRVKKWDVIASLTHDKDDISVSQSYTNLSMAQAKLNELYKWPDASVLTQLKSDISKSQATILTNKTDIESLTTEQKQKYNELVSQLNQMSWQLDNLLKDYQTSSDQSGKDISDQLATYSNTIKSSIQSFNSTKVKLADLLVKYDYIFWATDKYKDSRDRNWLSARNTSSKESAQIELQAIYSSFNSIQDIQYDTNLDISTYDVDWLKAKFNTLAALIKRFQARHQIAYDAVSNSVVAGDLTDQKISDYKSQITNWNSTLDSIYSSLQNSQNQILAMKSLSELTNDENKTLSDKLDTIQKARTSYLQIANQLAQLSGDYQQQITAKQNEISSTQDSIKYTNQKLQETQKPDTDSIAQQKLQIQLQKLSLASTQLWLKDYDLVAPFDGKIDKIDFIVWQQVSSEKVTISNPKQYKIDVSLDQVDIIYIKQWQPVSITLAAFPDTVLTGTVDQIYSIPTTENSVTSYTVSVTFNGSWLNIFPDMYGSVSFQFEKDKNEAVLIPLKSIQYDTWSSVPFIYVQNPDKTVVKKEIKIWQTDGQYIQVASGVNIWDKVVISPYIEQKVETSTFWPRWGAGWWWPR